MVSKNNYQFYQQKHADGKQRWGLRKLSVGVASVLLGTTFMLHSNHAVSADTVSTTTPTNATVQTDSNVADHQGSEVTLRTTADKEETVATTTNAEEKVVATNTQDTTQDKDKQTNANETTQNTTNVDKKDTEVTPTNDAKTPATQNATNVGNEVTPANGATPRKKFVRAALLVRKAETPDPTSTPTTSNNEEASTSLPMSNQDIKLDSQPMLTEITNKPTDNWVYKNLKSYQDSSTAKVKEILQKHTTNDERGRYYFAGVANYNESYHVIYLLARSNNLNDNDLYVTILHTGLSKNIQEEVVAPGESKKVEYSRTTHTPIFTNYDGTSVSIGLDGVEKGDNNFGMVVGFAYGQDTGISGDPASMGNGFMTTPMPTKTTTTIHYVDQATGDELAVPKSFEGVGYQKYTITGEAPTIDGYTLKKSPETTGYISPYKVGESYDFRLDKHVVIKQTVIDSHGFIRATAYYDGEAINNTTRYLGNMNDNDHFSFMSHGKSYTYINQITSTNDGIVYYYAKDGSEDKSEVRVHYIDVTGNKSSLFVPGDGKEVATDKISGKLGENYNYNVNLPTDYNLATNQENTVNGTYTIDHHDEYVYVVKKTSPATSATKAAAKDAIDQAAKAKNDAIDTSNLTAEEKDTLKKTVAGEVQKAKAAIDAATKDADVESAKNTGVGKINNINVPTTSATKDAAINAINTALSAKKTAINDTNLTAEEKSTLVNQAQKLADDAIANINKATTNDAVKTAKDTGVETINNMNVPTTSATKDAAINAINTALSAKKTAINDTNLTAEEKSTLVGQAQKLADDAIANINKATTNDAVKTAKDTGVETINNMNVPTTSATKDDAINAINTALADKKTAINGTNLTAEEKSTLVNQAQKLADDAIANINKATTNDAVKTAKDTGVETINNMNVPTTSATKDAAKDAIDQAAKTKDDAIDASNLTAEEKDALKKTVAGEVQTAKDNIDAATKDADVTTAKNTGVGKINNMNVPTTSATKDAAINAINTALADKKTAINGTNLTAEEKSTLVNQAQKLADDAIANINKATTNDAVKTAKDTGVETINNMNVPTTSATKDAAKDAIDQAAKTKDDAIDASNLTAEEKDALKKTVAGEVQTAKDNIDAATKDADVTTAKNTGVGKINNMNVPTTSATKDAAINAINTALADKKTAINGTNLTAEEKSTLVNQAQKLADDAIANINKATTNDAVKTAKDTGVETINSMNVPTTSATKDAAINAINTALADKKTAINGTNLTAEEKSTLVNQAQKLADDAIANINKATTNDAVKTAKDTGVETINNMNVPTTSATKDAAKDAIDQAAKTKDDAIDASNLTAEEKDALKKTVAGEVQTAKDNIDAATKDADVTTAKNTGVGKINNMNVPTTSATKEAAKNAIDQAAKTKNDAIDGSNLTDDEKAGLHKQVSDEVNKAKAAIDDAKKDADVTTAKNTGVEKINNINVPDTSATKDDANKATDAGNITPTVPGDKVTVKDPSHLTDDEKNQVKNNVDNANKDKFPDGTKVTVGDDGTATVTYPDGSKDTIPGDQLVQGQKGDTTDAGNITPTVPGDKVTVKDPSHLTDDEKNQVKNNVDNANKDKFPDGTKVTVGDDGKATVTYPDGSKDTIPGDQLVQGQKGDTTDAGKITPTVSGDKVTVKDPSHLTDDEKNQVKNNVDNANKDKFPAGTEVTVGDDGTATVTYPDGSKDTIPGDQLVQGQKGDTTDAGKITPTVSGDKVTVKDPSHLTDDEKNQVKNNVDNANKDKFPAGTEVTVGDDGTATVTYPDGSKDTIPGDQLVQGQKGDTTDADKITPTVPGDKVTVKDPSHLTDDEKNQVKNNVDNANKDKFPGGTDVKVGDDGTTTVTYPDGSKDTIPGDQLVQGQKGDTTDADKIIPTVPGDKVTVKDPSHLTDDEKNQVKNNVDNANKDKFPGGTDVKVGDDGTTTVTYPDGSKDTIPGDQLVQGQKGDTTDADKITPTVPGDKVTVKDPSHLTDDEKNQVKNNVDNANKDKFPGGTDVKVGDDGTTTVTYPDGSKDTIPGDQLVQGQKGDTTDADKITPTVPGDKVTVKDPSHLTDDEKNQVKNNVDNANKDKFPGGTDVKVGDDGTTTVTYPDGSKDTIPGDQLVQGQKGDTTDADKIIPTVPGDKVTVKDPSHLTDDEKNQVKNNVDNANKDKFPGGTDVKVGDDGTTTVTYPDGSKDTIPGDQLVQGQKGDTTDADKITPTVPGDKVTVKDPSHLTDSEKDQVKTNVTDANKDKFPGGTDVKVGDDGTTTVTYPDGSKDTIPGSDLVRQSTDADKTTPSVPETKVPVADPSHLTDSEKDQVKTNVTDANKDNLPSGSQITVGNDGTTTVTYPDGSKDTIPGDKVLEGKSDVKSDADKNEPKEPGDKVKVDDPNKLTDSEKEELSNNLEKLNPGTVVTIADDGTATLTYPDGSTNTIPGSQLVTAKGNGNTTNSNVKVTPTNTNNKINKDNNSLGKNTANAKAGELPQTGETNDSQKLSVIGMALMGILGLFGLGKKRKKD